MKRATEGNGFLALVLLHTTNCFKEAETERMWAGGHGDRQHSSREEGYGERRGDKKKQIRDAEKQHFVQLESLPTSRDTIDTRDVSAYELGLAVVDCHYF